jgi:hypothetical protein
LHELSRWRHPLHRTGLTLGSTDTLGGISRIDHLLQSESLTKEMSFRSHLLCAFKNRAI